MVAYKACLTPLSLDRNAITTLTASSGAIVTSLTIRRTIVCGKSFIMSLTRDCIEVAKYLLRSNACGRSAGTVCYECNKGCTANFLPLGLLDIQVIVGQSPMNPASEVDEFPMCLPRSELAGMSSPTDSSTNQGRSRRICRPMYAPTLWPMIMILSCPSSAKERRSSRSLSTLRIMFPFANSTWSFRAKMPPEDHLEICPGAGSMKLQSEEPWMLIRALLLLSPECHFL